MRAPGSRRPEICSAVGLLVVAGCLSGGGCQKAAEQRAASLLRARCSRCHPEDHALQKRKTAQEWKRTVWSMRQRGAQLSNTEAELLVEYLSRTRGR